MAKFLLGKEVLFSLGKKILDGIFDYAKTTNEELSLGVIQTKREITFVCMINVLDIINTPLLSPEGSFPAPSWLRETDLQRVLPRLPALWLPAGFSPWEILAGEKRWRGERLCIFHIPPAPNA